MVGTLYTQSVDVNCTMYFYLSLDVVTCTNNIIRQPNELEGVLRRSQNNFILAITCGGREFAEDVLASNYIVSHYYSYFLG